MFLREIELKNFKCHENLFLSFETDINSQTNRKTTFVLGENGTGKSALLKAIALVTAGSSSLGNLLGESDEWIRNGEHYCEISAVIVTSENKERQIKLRIDKNVELKKIIDKNAASLDLIDRAISHTDRNYFVVGYGASRRLNNDSHSSGLNLDFSSARSQNIKSLFNADSRLISLSNWAMELDYTGEEDGLRSVKRALNAFLVDNVRFKSIDKKNKQLIFTTPDGDIPLNQLSDGYQNVSAWVGDLMYRINNFFSNFKNPLKARGILLIDEIDLHLHPKWQRQLHSFLKAQLPNFQVIATTHSPITAQQANEFELYALRRNRKKVELIPFRGSPNKMLLHQILMSPVFGLDTDESLKVEEAKSQIREISLKGRKSLADMAKIKEYSRVLDLNPVNIRTNSLLSEEELNLLDTINQELKTKK